MRRDVALWGDSIASSNMFFAGVRGSVEVDNIGADIGWDLDWGKEEV